MDGLRTCVGCKEPKPVTEFYRQPARKDGLFIRCKTCTCEDSARYYREHVDQRRKYGRDRYRRMNGLPVSG